MEEQEKLAVDIFVKYSTQSLANFQMALRRAKGIMMQGIHLDHRFNPQKYARYYLTFRILKMPEKTTFPQFNIFQQRIERLHNAAMSIEMLEMQISSLGDYKEHLFFYLEIGGLYALKIGEQEDITAWFELE